VKELAVPGGPTFGHHEVSGSIEMTFTSPEFYERAVRQYNEAIDLATKALAEMARVFLDARETHILSDADREMLREIGIPDY
jgi:hypothetical protein